MILMRALLFATGLALAWRRRGRTLGATGKSQPVDFADHGISGHVTEFGGNLARRKSGFPEFLQLLDAIVRPGQYRHRTLSFALRRPVRGRAAVPKL